MKVTIPANTIGVVTNFKDNRVVVKCKITVEGKLKEIQASFKAESLEVQKALVQNRVLHCWGAVCELAIGMVAVMTTAIIATIPHMMNMIARARLIVQITTSMNLQGLVGICFAESWGLAFGRELKFVHIATIARGFASSSQLYCSVVRCTCRFAYLFVCID